MQLKEREPFYNKAKHIIDVTVMDNRGKIKITVDTIKKELGIDEKVDH